MSGIISVIIWIVIMAAVSGVLKGKSNGSGTKDRNPYNKNGTTVPPQNTWNNGNAEPRGTAGLFRRYGSGKAQARCSERNSSNTAGINGNRKAGQYVND